MKCKCGYILERKDNCCTECGKLVRIPSYPKLTSYQGDINVLMNDKLARQVMLQRFGSKLPKGFIMAIDPKDYDFRSVNGKLNYSLVCEKGIPSIQLPISFDTNDLMISALTEGILDDNRAIKKKSNDDIIEIFLQRKYKEVTNFNKTLNNFLLFDDADVRHLMSKARQEVYKRYSLNTTHRRMVNEVEQKIVKWFGGKCSEYEIGCPVCEAYKFIEHLKRCYYV